MIIASVTHVRVFALNSVYGIDYKASDIGVFALNSLIRCLYLSLPCGFMMWLISTINPQS